MDRHHTVKGDRKTLVEGNKHTHVRGNHLEKVEGDMSHQVGGRRDETIASVYALESGDEIYIKSGAKIIIECGLRISVIASGGFIDIGSGGVAIQGSMVFINSGGSPGFGSGVSLSDPQEPLGERLARARAESEILKESATEADAAAVSSIPTTEQTKEIQEYIKQGKYQHAINKAIEYYGIDVANVRGGKVTYDPKLTDANAETGSDRSVRVGPSAVRGVTPGRLGATLVHESTHANQIAKHGWPKSGQEVASYEAMGYQSALKQSDRLGVTSAQQDWYKRKVTDNYDKLSDENQRKYGAGQYWDLK
jgi:hypothetical protein